MDTLWDATKADELFRRAALAVEKVANRNFHRDNIRTLPFTKAVISHCTKEAGQDVAV
jgi:hypothetical protein